MITASAIQEGAVRRAIDRAKTTVLKREDEDLLREFSRQVLDTPEYYDDGCPLCGDIK